MTNIILAIIMTTLFVTVIEELTLHCGWIFSAVILFFYIFCALLSHFNNLDTKRKIK